MLHSATDDDVERGVPKVGLGTSHTTTNFEPPAMEMRESVAASLTQRRLAAKNFNKSCERFCSLSMALLLFFGGWVSNSDPFVEFWTAFYLLFSYNVYTST
jgi:hypothetical protein